MRSLDELSGPWHGLSTQYGQQIAEDIHLRMEKGLMAGSGSDKDGDFTVEGSYDAAGNVQLIRRYTYCVSGPSGIGIPYLYIGQWDGEMVTGRWSPFLDSFYGGPFEMWPAREEDLQDLRIESLIEPTLVPSGS